MLFSYDQGVKNDYFFENEGTRKSPATCLSVLEDAIQGSRIAPPPLSVRAGYKRYMLVIFVPRLGALCGFRLAERHRYTGNTVDTLFSTVKSRYVTRCCAPSIASPRYLYHSMRETRHSSFVRICIIGRGGILYAGQGTTSLPWPIYSSRRSSPYVREDRSISRRNWSIDFFFLFFFWSFAITEEKSA